MKITSTTTLVTGSDEGPVYHPPGTLVDLSKGHAEDLISRGLAQRVTAPKGQEPEKPPGVNLNEADVDSILAIKGVGKKTAGDIVASREADGPFESLQDAANRVGGVSLEQLVQAGATL